MGTTANDAEIIILSDDEDEASENDTPCTGPGVCVVEPENRRNSGNIWIYFRHPPVPAVLLLLFCK